MAGELKCPHCGSSDVIECPVNVLEDMVGGVGGAGGVGGIPTMTSPGLNPFGVLKLLTIPKNAAIKAYDLIADRKRYLCKKCEKFFYK